MFSYRQEVSGPHLKLNLCNRYLKGTLRLSLLGGSQLLKQQVRGGELIPKKKPLELWKPNTKKGQLTCRPLF